MTTITTRAAKGTPLTNDEIDANFTGLNTDKLEKAGGTVLGALTVNGAVTANAALAANGTVAANGGLTVTGNVAVSGAAPRITGDFSTATHASRLSFQSSVANGITYVHALPNGTAQNSGFAAWSSSNPSSATYTDISNNGVEGRIRSGATGTGALLPLTFYTGNSERLRIDAYGNVGIGNSSPGYKLDVLGSVTAGGGGEHGHYNLRNAAGTQVLDFGVNTFSGASDSVGINVSTATGTLDLGTNGALALRIAANGRVCINRTSSSFAAGAARSALAFDGGSEWGMGIKNTNAGAATSYPFAFLNASEGIAGSISITSTTTGYNTSSDVRLKENIEDAADSGPVIDAVQVRQFDWKETGEHQDFGVIAQELELVFPSAVTVPQIGPDGEEMHRGVDYSKLVPLLIKEVQSLRARVAQLEGGAQ